MKNESDSTANEKRDGMNQYMFREWCGKVDALWHFVNAQNLRLGTEERPEMFIARLRCHADNLERCLPGHEHKPKSHTFEPPEGMKLNAVRMDNGKSIPCFIEDKP